MEKTLKNLNTQIEPSNPVSENGESWPYLTNQAWVQNEMRKKFSIIARTSKYSVSQLFTPTLSNNINQLNNDGAAAVVLMKETKVKELCMEPMAYFRSCAIAGSDPTLTYPAVPCS